MFRGLLRNRLVANFNKPQAVSDWVPVDTASDLVVETDTSEYETCDLCSARYLIESRGKHLTSQTHKRAATAAAAALASAAARGSTMA